MDAERGSSHEGEDVLPRFVGGEKPEPESRARLFKIRGLALTSLAVTFGYLIWRASGTVDLSVWWVSVPLYAAEWHNAIGLTLYTVSLWNIDVLPPLASIRQIRSKGPKVAVLLPTYNESETVLLPAIAAAVALEPSHETWVLDDGRRPEIKELAEELGAKYMTRDSNEGAKAGNLNNALTKIDADIIAVLDADYVALPGFLTQTLPYFADPNVALVQTPQDFYNKDSFEHELIDEEGDRFFCEESVFYRVIAPGKNYWGAAFWCGTCALVRVEALESVGGVATNSVTEDIHTSIRMSRVGWKSVFHNEVLARGLAPADAAQYMTQRNRWAQGAMQVLRKENPLFGRGLSFGQRLSFASTLFGWFDSWRSFTYIVLPLLVLTSGASPINAPGRIYLPLFLLVLISQFFALRLLARGYYPPLLSLIFEMLRMPAVLPATISGLFGSVGKFKVTPKGKMGDERVRTPVPALLKILTWASIGSLGWFVVALTGLTPFSYSMPAVAVGAAMFTCGNLILLIMAIRRIRSSRFVSERREAYRFDTVVAARIGGMDCTVRDISATGARVEGGIIAAAILSESRATLSIDLPDQTLHIACAVKRNLVEEGGQVELGLLFLPDQREAAGALILHLLNNGAQAKLPDHNLTPLAA